MSETKHCFIDEKRPCTLACKAAFEVDDPIDNIDCHFVWLSYHAGETLFDLKRLIENFRGPGGASGGAEGTPPSGGGGPFPGFGPKKPKGHSNN